VPGSNTDQRLQSQSTATLGDGRVFVIGGSWNGGVGNKTGEVRAALRLKTVDAAQPSRGRTQLLPLRCCCDIAILLLTGLDSILIPVSDPDCLGCDVL